MKKNQFEVLSAKERRAKLLALLAKKSEGKLTKNELEVIVNNVNIDTQYNVFAITDAHLFNSHAQLKDHYIGASAMSDYRIDEYGEVILGNLEFGRDYKYYKHFGYDDIDETELIDSKFNLESAQCFVKKKVNSSEDYPEHFLVVFIPTVDSFKVDPCVQYVLDNFNIM